MRLADVQARLGDTSLPPTATDRYNRFIAATSAGIPGILEEIARYGGSLVHDGTGFATEHDLVAAAGHARIDEDDVLDVWAAYAALSAGIP